MIRTEMLLEAAGGRSAISRQAPVPLIAECARFRRKRTADLANRIPSLLRSSPWPRDREPRCARRSDDTEAPTGWGRLLARSLTSLFHEPPPEPCLQLSPHTALQRPESQKVGSGHFGYLAPYRSGPPAPLRHVTGSPGLGLLRGLRRLGARAR